MDYERDNGERHDNDHAPFETSHRIILSSKRIDIIVTDNAHYVCAEGQWVSSYYYQHWTNWDLFINYLARIVRVECNGAKTGSGSWDSINAPFKVPDKCVPKRRLNAPVVVQNGGSTTKMLSVDADGTVSLSNQGGAGSANSCLGGITYIY